MEIVASQLRVIPIMERRTRAANPRSGGDSPVARRTQRQRAYTDTRCGSVSATHGVVGIETRGAARAYCACSIGTASTQQSAKPMAPSSLRSMAAIIPLVDARNATVYAIPLNKISGGFSIEYRSHGLASGYKEIQIRISVTDAMGPAVANTLNPVWTIAEAEQSAKRKRCTPPTFRLISGDAIMRAHEQGAI